MLLLHKFAEDFEEFRGFADSVRSNLLHCVGIVHSCQCFTKMQHMSLLQRPLLEMLSEFQRYAEPFRPVTPPDSDYDEDDENQGERDYDAEDESDEEEEEFKPAQAAVSSPQATSTVAIPSRDIFLEDFNASAPSRISLDETILELTDEGLLRFKTFR